MIRAGGAPRTRPMAAVHQGPHSAALGQKQLTPTLQIRTPRPTAGKWGSRRQNTAAPFNVPHVPAHPHIQTRAHTSTNRDLTTCHFIRVQTVFPRQDTGRVYQPRCPPCRFVPSGPREEAAQLTQVPEPPGLQDLPLGAGVTCRHPAGQPALPAAPHRAKPHPHCPAETQVVSAEMTGPWRCWPPSPRTRQSRRVRPRQRPCLMDPGTALGLPTPPLGPTVETPIFLTIPSWGCQRLKPTR